MSHRQSGATIVEFALVLIAFLMFTLGLMDFARLLYMWNSVTEATRAGARYAVVCAAPNGSSGKLLDRMRALEPQISDFQLDWLPAGCDVSNCQGARVTITKLSFSWLAPIPNALTPSLFLPSTSFNTYLPREIARQDPNSAAICD